MTDTTHLSDELAHITQEMYKKNLELANKNKALSLLRQVDAIILSSVTEITQIAQQVAETVVREGGVQILSLFIVEDQGKNLRTLYTSYSGEQQEVTAYKPLVSGKITHVPTSGFYPVVSEKRMCVYKLFSEIFPQENTQESQAAQKKLQVDQLFTYPLISHEKVVGIMMIGMRGKEEVIGQYKEDVLDRLSSIVSVAIENALLYQELRIANQKLQELDQLKDEFVSVASHELRTPLTAIRSYLWMALEGKGGALTEKQKYYLDRSYNSTIRLIKLVNDMLNISRIESGRMEFDIQKVDMSKVIQDVVGEVKPRADELHLTIENRMHEEQLWVVADPDKMHEVLINLIGNALKFTPSGGKIVLSCRKEGGRIIFMVQDTGTGIAKEDISRLFQKFGMIQGSYITNQAATQGTGLGLYICRSIMQKHGGDIWVTSEGRNKGTTFYFSLIFYTSEEQVALQRGKSVSSGLGIIHSEL